MEQIKNDWLIITGNDLNYALSRGFSIETTNSVSEWVSSFLTAHQHKIGHSVP